MYTSLFCTWCVINNLASRTYELSLGKGGTVVMVDGMESPLITLQYRVQTALVPNVIGLAVDSIAVTRPWLG